ncbi:ABC transporter ATP-binding protein [Corynebacterium bovis]|uniref:ABC transporter ATP-binding protein n=1 Tax=Corynebacterium bovis TaxID=36808 RepID=UPI003139E43C
MLTHLHVLTGGGPRYRGFLVLTVLSAVLQAGAVLALFPTFDRLFGDHPSGAWPWVLVVVALIAAAWGIDVVAARLGLALGIQVMRVIHERTPEAVLAWPSSILTAEKTASLRRLVSSGATEATSSVFLMVSPVVTAVVFTPALGLGLLTVSVPVALVTVAGGVLVLAALWLSTRLQARSETAFSRATEELDSRLFEFAWAQPSLRTARHVSAGEALVDDAIESTRRRSLRLLLWQIPGEFVFSAVLQVVLLGFGLAAWTAYDSGTLSAVGAATLVIVLLRVVEQVTTVSGSVTGVLAVTRTLAEVREVTDVAPVTPSRPAPTAPHVVADGLEVTYGDGTAGLRDASLDLAPGTVTVVVGRSGAGKTTLLRALAGLEPASGGGVSLAGPGGPRASLGDLRGNATVVFQQTALNAGTVRENLLSVNPALSQEELDGIARTAQLTRTLQRLPGGWDTPAGELGSQLSGGERQRVGIARALAKPARFLLVDEATSALDARNERAVVDAISGIRGDYTTVIVTHSPATLAVADEVVVMDGGRITEQGPPAELEAAGGEFTRILDEWRRSAAWHV